MYDAVLTSINKSGKEYRSAEPVTCNMKIVVLCGGLSNERDVSIASGQGIANALKNKGHHVVLVDLYFGYEGDYEKPDDIFQDTGQDSVETISDTHPDLQELKNAKGSKSKIGENVLEISLAADLVFMALHGEDGENGKLQSLFDLYGVKYTGTGPMGSAIAMNKGVSKELFEHHGIKTPFGCVLVRGEKLPDDIKLPVVVKPCSGGSSVGVSIVSDEVELREGVHAAFELEDSLIIEQYIEGREFSIGVIAGEALPIIEICPKSGFYDYKNKYQHGMTDEFCPADLPEQITEKMRQAAVKAFKVLRMECYGRIDFILDKNDEYHCLEGNTLPGMTPLSLMPQEAEAVGMSYADLCEKIIEVSMEKYI